MSDSNGTEGTHERVAPAKGKDAPQPPHLNLPKGGGAIRGIGEKFTFNPATGAGAMSVPIATSAGRSEFTPLLSLDYDSSAGNGSFGFGWSLGTPSIYRKTAKGLPQYDDDGESDTFILLGAEDLIPVLKPDGSRDADTTTDPNYVIRRYRPRVEAQFDRIERWTDITTFESHWRTISRDNTLTIYGRDELSRVSDPHDPTRVFSWLVAERRDDKGNGVIFDYKKEDGEGVEFTKISERNRGTAADPRRSVQRYLKSIRYGNRNSLLDPSGARPRFLSDAKRSSADWMFEIVLDYGEHDQGAPLPGDANAWYCRNDPYSSYRGGFELRSYRLCQRILLFHHFETEPGIGADCLVRSTDIGYRDSRNNPDDVKRGNPNATFIATITQCGYVRSGAGYLKKSMPQLAFEYSDAQLQEEVQELDDDSLAQLPVGLDANDYSWVDLDGEGVSGILTEQGGNWLFKRNRGDGRFAASEAVTTRPATAALTGGRQQLLDLNGDGRLELAEFSGAGAGFFTRTMDEDWEPFRSFSSLPNIPWHEPNLRFVDLNGDGLADVLITEQDVFTWYPSLGSAGFGLGERIQHVPDEERGPHALLSDGIQTIFLADMCGDGLLDLVRVRSGEVCYWPHLGYGRFGARVSMDNAPRLDRLEQFDARRVRLADLDGSGTTDIVYLGTDGVALYFNLSGNQWSEPRRLAHYPKIDNVASVSVIDLLGHGTMCLVWSSPLPEASRSPLRFIDLMGQKPHLLTKCVNNLGTETVIRYAPSTRFYLADRDEGRPWVTRLPFPVHVVERVETYDRVSRNRFVTRNVYHHGHFDGVEREFRGFGMVEQLDTEELGANADDGAFPDAVNVEADSYVPPVLTKTWFHTGAFVGGQRISRYYAAEYYREGDPVTATGELTDAQFQSSLLDDSVLPVDLTAEQMREGCRALRGHVLRQEVYASDDTDASCRPYSISERNYTITLLQGFGPNPHAAFVTHSRETIDCHYERALYKVGGNTVSDPRVSHSVVLSVDRFGNELRSAAIAYGRRYPDPDPLLTAGDRAKQKQTLVTATESSYTNFVDDPDSYRTPMPADVQTFEIIKPGAPTLSANPTQTYSFTDLATGLQQAGDGMHDIPYEDINAAAAVQNAPYRRSIERERHLYRADNLASMLAVGALQSLGLPGVTYKQAFTSGLLSGCFRRTHGGATEELIPDPAVTLGGKEGDAGAYVDLDGDGRWWIPGGRSFYAVGVNVADPALSAAAELISARQHFFLSRSYADPFDQVTEVDFDGHDLLVIATRDSIQNAVAASYDYRVLQPNLVTEANGNPSEAAYDALGLLSGTAVRAKNTALPGDSLTGFSADLTAKQLADFFADPRGAPAVTLLGSATSRIIYDLDRYTTSGTAALPVYAATIVRETHLSDLDPGDSSALQTSFSYSDGMGREIQRKFPAEDGPLAPGVAAVPSRWVGSGWVVFNNKGMQTRVYEPFFDDTHDFKFAYKAGVSRVLFYDPLGRAVATLHPNMTWEKVIFDPWRQTSWDVNDTVAVPDPAKDPDVGQYLSRLPNFDYTDNWYTARKDGVLGPQEQDAAAKTLLHAGTPAVACFDTLGRTFLTIANNGEDAANNALRYVSRSMLDIEGNVRVVKDALDRMVMTYDYDMLGNIIHQSSMEAGERWMLNDATGKSIRTWDSRLHTFRTAYDALRRPVEVYLGDDTPHDVLVARTVYGESIVQPEVMNLRGRIYQQFDQAGIVTHESYDFQGNLQSTTRQLAAEYRGTLDWTAAVPADGTIYRSVIVHDALNRPISITAPDNSVIRPGYNRANFLEKVDANLRGQQQGGVPVWTSFVTNIDYDEKGQRALIAYGNGATTRYKYDTKTFRLTSLQTSRPHQPSAGGPPPNGGGGGNNPDWLQDLNYTYDPAGNITYIRDAAQQTIFFRQKKVEPSNDYTYDPLYRLTQAKGREHLGQNGGKPFSPTISGADDSFRTNLDHPGDGTAMGTYIEAYLYDAVGNLLTLGHAGSDPHDLGWNRIYSYNEPSLIEPGRMSNRLSGTKLGATIEACKYSGSAGLHGNITFMPHLPVMQWDFRDQLQATSRQAFNSGTPETTWYVYDGDGQRVRKITDSATQGTAAPSRVRERIYLGIFEIYREYAPKNGPASFERQTLHLMDDKRRIALVETRTQGDDDSAAQLSRYQLGNHLGSASLELNDQANIISYEEYFPYGSTSYQAVDKSIKAAVKRYRYTGMERDEENGFSYHSARYYAPWLGRWTSVDPALFLQNAGQRGRIDQPYVYVENRPIVGQDTTGRFIFLVVLVAVALTALTVESHATAPETSPQAAHAAKSISNAQYAGHVAVNTASALIGGGLTSKVFKKTGSFLGSLFIGGAGSGAVAAPLNRAVSDAGGGHASSVGQYAGDVATGALVGGITALALGASFRALGRLSKVVSASEASAGTAALEAPITSEPSAGPALAATESAQAGEAPQASSDAAARPVVNIHYRGKITTSPSFFQFLRFNAELAQSEYGGFLIRGARNSADSAFRAWARNWLIRAGARLAGLDAAHPLDSSINPWVQSGTPGRTYYFGSRSVNRAFGGQLAAEFKRLALRVGSEFEIRFHGSPSYEAVPPVAPLGSPPGIPTGRGH